MLLSAILCAAGALQAAPTVPPGPLAGMKTAALFQPAQVWTVRLSFTLEQWTAMEPKGGDFGPGGLLTPAFLDAGDSNHDGALTRDEITAMGASWIAAWDTDKTGAATSDQVRDGLNKVVRMPFMGGKPGAMNLQGREGKRNGVAGALGIDFPLVHGSLQFDGKPYPEVAVRYKGNGTFLESRASLKRSLKVDVEKFAKGRTLAGVTTINLHNNVTDPSWMNDALAYRLYRDAGVPAPRTAYARVYVSVPGKHDNAYFGLYSVVEDVGAQFARERFGADAGAIFKPVTPELFNYLGEDWKKYNQTYDPKTELTDDQKKRIIAFCKFATQASDTDFAARLGDYVDMDEFARYMAVTVWISELDGVLGPGQNHYLHLNARTNKLAFIPWDLDHSFGQFAMRGTQEQRETLSIHKPWQGEHRFLERVFAVPAFKSAYLAHLRDFSKRLFVPQRLAQQVDALGVVLRPAVQEESPDKLARFDQVVAGKVLPPPPMPGPGGFGGAPTKPIKVFAGVRARSVVAQLNGTEKGSELAEFNLFGGGDPPPAPGPDQNKRPAFGPGTFLAPALVVAFDKNKDGKLTAQELSEGLGGWFDTWSGGTTGPLKDDALSAGINKTFSTLFGPPPGQRPEGPR